MSKYFIVTEWGNAYTADKITENELTAYRAGEITTLIDLENNKEYSIEGKWVKLENWEDWEKNNK